MRIIPLLLIFLVVLSEAGCKITRNRNFRTKGSAATFCEDSQKENAPDSSGKTSKAGEKFVPKISTCRSTNLRTACNDADAVWFDLSSEGKKSCLSDIECPCGSHCDAGICAAECGEEIACKNQEVCSDLGLCVAKNTPKDILDATEKAGLIADGELIVPTRVEARADDEMLIDATWNGSSKITVSGSPGILVACGAASDDFNNQCTFSEVSKDPAKPFLAHVKAMFAKGKAKSNSDGYVSFQTHNQYKEVSIRNLEGVASYDSYSGEYEGFAFDITASERDIEPINHISSAMHAKIWLNQAGDGVIQIDDYAQVLFPKTTVTEITKSEMLTMTLPTQTWVTGSVGGKSYSYYSFFTVYGVATESKLFSKGFSFFVTQSVRYGNEPETEVFSKTWRIELNRIKDNTESKPAPTPADRAAASQDAISVSPLTQKVYQSSSNFPASIPSEAKSLNACRSLNPGSAISSFWRNQRIKGSGALKVSIDRQVKDRGFDVPPNQTPTFTVLGMNLTAEQKASLGLPCKLKILPQQMITSKNPRDQAGICFEFSPENAADAFAAEVDLCDVANSQYGCTRTPITDPAQQITTGMSVTGNFGNYIDSIKGSCSLNSYNESLGIQILESCVSGDASKNDESCVEAALCSTFDKGLELVSSLDTSSADASADWVCKQNTAIIQDAVDTTHGVDNAKDPRLARADPTNLPLDDIMPGYKVPLLDEIKREGLWVFESAARCYKDLQELYDANDSIAIDRIFAKDNHCIQATRMLAVLELASVADFSSKPSFAVTTFMREIVKWSDFHVQHLNEAAISYGLYRIFQLSLDPMASTEIGAKGQNLVLLPRVVAKLLEASSASVSTRYKELHPKIHGEPVTLSQNNLAPFAMLGMSIAVQKAAKAYIVAKRWDQGGGRLVLASVSPWIRQSILVSELAKRMVVKMAAEDKQYEGLPSALKGQLFLLNQLITPNLSALNDIASGNYFLGIQPGEVLPYLDEYQSEAGPRHFARTSVFYNALPNMIQNLSGLFGDKLDQVISETRDFTSQGTQELNDLRSQEVSTKSQQGEDLIRLCGTHMLPANVNKGGFEIIEYYMKEEKAGRHFSSNRCYKVENSKCKNDNRAVLTQPELDKVRMDACMLSEARRILGEDVLKKKMPEYVRAKSRFDRTMSLFLIAGSAAASVAGGPAGLAIGSAQITTQITVCNTIDLDTSVSAQQTDGTFAHTYCALFEGGDKQQVNPFVDLDLGQMLKESGLDPDSQLTKDAKLSCENRFGKISTMKPRPDIDIDKDCVEGEIGKTYLEAQAAHFEMIEAREKMDLLDKQYQNKMEVCDVKQSTSDSKAKMRQMHDAWMNTMNDRKLVCDSIATGAEAVASCASTVSESGLGGLTGSGAVACGAQAVAAGAKIASAAIATDIDNENRRYENQLAQLDELGELKECVIDAKSVLLEFDNQYAAFQSATQRFYSAVKNIDVTKSQADSSWFTALRDLQRIQILKEDANGFYKKFVATSDSLLDTIKGYNTALDQAKAYSYVGLYSMAYEEQSDIAKQDLVDILKITSESGLYVPQTKITDAFTAQQIQGARNPSEITDATFSLRNLIGSGPAKDRVNQLRTVLQDTRYRVRDEKGKLVGIRIPFSIVPERHLTEASANLSDRCAETLWSVRLAILGEQNFAKESGIELRIQKSPKFYRRYCDPDKAKTGFQNGFMRPGVNFLKDGGGQARNLTTEPDFFISASNSSVVPEFESDISGLEKDSLDYKNPSKAFAGMGLYGDYRIWIPASSIHSDYGGLSADGVKLNQVNDIRIKVELVSVIKE